MPLQSRYVFKFINISVGVQILYRASACLFSSRMELCCTWIKATSCSLHQSPQFILFIAGAVDEHPGEYSIVAVLLVLTVPPMSFSFQATIGCPRFIDQVRKGKFFVQHSFICSPFQWLYYINGAIHSAPFFYHICLLLTVSSQFSWASPF